MVVGLAGRVSAQIPVGLTQIPQVGMTATASSTYTTYAPGNAIDGNAVTLWQTQTAAPQWFQVDLGGRHAIGAIDLLETASYRVKGYQLFVSDTPTPATWDTPVAAGELPNSTGPHVIAFPFASGRYVRLLITSYWSTRIYIYEMRIYGNAARLADLQTGSTAFTDSNTVSVVDFPAIANYTHFQIVEGNQTPDPDPGAWTSTNTPPGTLTFPQPASDTNILMMLWYTNLTARVAPVRQVAQIRYAMDAPVAAIDSTLTRYLYAGYPPVTLTDVDFDIGTSFGYYFDRPIDRHAIDLFCPEDATPESPVVTLTAPGVYEVVFTAVSAVGKSDSLTSTVTVVEVALAALRLWTGAGANALASTTNNWNGGIAPASGDHILFDTAHFGKPQTNCTWDLAVAPGSWAQTTKYAGTVTFQTRYPDQGGFTNLTITGTCTLEGGVWTHPGPQTAQIYNLGLSVGGDFTLGGGALVNLDSKGWKDANGNTQVGPGGGAVGGYHATYAPGAAHGGMGGDRDWKSDYSYGSIFRPTHLGSGGARSSGGGAMRLSCEGIVTIQGEVRARASSYEGYSGASGGSIFIQAAAITGTNKLVASAQLGSDAGAGGRIAVVLTAGSSFGSVVMEAFGGKGSMAGAYASSQTREGAAGTIYLQKAGQSANQGTLILDNGGLPNYFPAVTTLPAAQLGETTLDLSAFEKIVVRNGAVLFARPGITLDLTTANINPDGYDDGWIAVMQTNNIVFPAGSFTLDTYNLVFGTNWLYQGDLTLAAPVVVSHFGSTGNTQDYRLDMTVTGNLTVMPGAAIDVSFRGFLVEKGPGVAYGRSSSPYGYGASHGGRGARTAEYSSYKTYGNFMAPVTFGSGGSGQWNHAGYFGFLRGGGAARLTVGGDTLLEGELLALGGSNNDWSCPASGGSIWLTTGTLSGAGRIDVRGGLNARPGGGGRIAIHLTGSDSFGKVVLDASGRSGSAGVSAAGTIYRQRPDATGELRIDNGGFTTAFPVVHTPVPADLDAPLLTSPWRAAQQVTLVVTNRASVALNLDLTMKDIYLRNNQNPTRLNLQGHTLKLNSIIHDDWGNEAWVVYDAGQIIWQVPGTVILIR
jgi:hypothetical protein